MFTHLIEITTSSKRKKEEKKTTHLKVSRMERNVAPYHVSSIITIKRKINANHNIIGYPNNFDLGEHQ